MQFTIKLIVLSLITQRPPITCPYLYPYMDVKDTQECTNVYIVHLHYSLDMLDSREVKSSNMQTHVQGRKSNAHGKLLGRDLLHRTSIQRNANMYTHTETTTEITIQAHFECHTYTVVTHHRQPTYLRKKKVHLQTQKGHLPAQCS